MMKIVFAAGAMFVVAYAGSANAQSRGNASLEWSGAWVPPSASDQALLNSQALIDLQIAHGILNPGASSTTNYYGTVDQTYTGPNTSSGSAVTNIGNLSSTSINTTATNSTVSTGVTTGQTANGATQSGSATSDAATGNGGFNAANTITTLAH